MCVMVRSRGSEMEGGGETRVVKREPGSRRIREEEDEETRRGGGEGETRIVKRERVSRRNREEEEETRGGGGGGGGRRESPPGETSDSGTGGRQEVVERRVLRSRYLAVKTLINDEKEDIAKVDSDRFNSIIGQVESLHELVLRPREQVADAEALLDIANTLALSVKSYGHDGVTPGDFITSLLRNFGQQNGVASAENFQSVDWKDLGVTVSHIFTKGPGCCTMLGPMDTEVKQRKTVTQRKRVRPTESARPEDLNKNEEEERTDTDMNMLTMFNILRKKRSVRLENLILNRNSFAQTVENLFALSFLVKDGRAEIAVDDKGCHFVAPKNAPAANAVMSGNAAYSHFVFRLDYKDWKLMDSVVTIGEELMPHRNRNISESQPSQEDHVHENSQGGAPTTPIRKLCRNRGLVIQEQSVVEDSPENDNSAENAAAIRKGKRELHQ